MEIESGKTNDQIYRKFYKVYLTICQMMLDRGYVLIGDNYTHDEIEQLESQSVDGFMEYFKNKWSELKPNSEVLYQQLFANEDGNGVIVKFLKYVQEKPHQLLKDGNLLEFSTNDAQKLILVYPGNYESVEKSAKQRIEEKRRDNTLEIFDENDLTYNITRHKLVPKHVKLTDEEKTELLKKYKINSSQLPKILYNDPVSRYFGLRRGDVFKIIRTSETAGQYITYRICA